MKNKFLVFLTIALSLITSCKTTEESTNTGAMTPNNKTTKCQLIEKEFTNKGGKVTEYKELYLRCSVQDYFI
ncbi:MAG: hypothetical protein JKX68_04760 [Flavobacteriales bacterium]|nr:hypothetical protein [Flavobacteriales bacterium]